jgi:hypothetical protein
LKGVKRVSFADRNPDLFCPRCGQVKDKSEDYCEDRLYFFETGETYPLQVDSNRRIGSWLNSLGEPGERTTQVYVRKTTRIRV